MLVEAGVFGTTGDRHCAVQPWNRQRLAQKWPARQLVDYAPLWRGRQQFAAIDNQLLLSRGCDEIPPTGDVGAHRRPGGGRHHRSPTTWVPVALLASLLALSACGGGGATRPAAVVTGSHLPAGLNVSAARAPSAPGFVPLSPVVRVTPSGRLVSPATVRIRLDRGVPTGDTVLVRTAESPAGPWTLLSASVSPSTRTVSVTTQRFSLFQALGLDLGAAVKAFKSDFIDGLDSGATQTVAKPSCAGQSEARAAGYSIASSTTDTVYWCFGMSGSTRVLKVTDNRRYPLEVLHPGLTVTDRGAIDWVSLPSVSHWGSGKASIIAPGDTVTYSVEVAPGDRGGIQTEMDGLGQSLTAVEVGADTLVSILTRWGAGSGEKTADEVGKLLEVRSCADALGKGSGALISGCFSPKDVLDAFGLKGLLLAPVMAAGEVIGFLHGELNALVDQVNGHDQYEIVIASPATGAPSSSSGFAARTGATLVRCVASTPAGGYTTTGESQPTLCSFHKAQSSYDDSNQVLIQDMKWSGWGSPTATAVGTFSHMDVTAPATLTLTGLQRCSTGGAIYTHLSGQLHGVSTFTMPLDGCPPAAQPSSPSAAGGGTNSTTCTYPGGLVDQQQTIRTQGPAKVQMPATTASAIAAKIGRGETGHPTPASGVPCDVAQSVIQQALDVMSDRKNATVDGRWTGEAGTYDLGPFDCAATGNLPWHVTCVHASDAAAGTVTITYTVVSDVD